MEYTPSNYINRNFSYSTSDEWFYIHGSTPLSSDHGWKLYVSFSVPMAERVLHLLADKLVSLGVHFKYIKNTSLLTELNSGRLGYSQIGKSLVIYMPYVDPDAVDSIIYSLSNQIDSYPVPPYLKRLHDDAPVFYRYGEYRDISPQTSNEEPENIDSRYVLEQREFPISEKISRNNTSAPLTDVDRLFLQYPIVDLISQRGKGGVFLALDFSEPTYTEVIVKTGYLHGEENELGNDGIFLIRNEESFINYINRLSISNFFSPSLKATAEGRDAYVVVQSKCPGTNAATLLDSDAFNENLVYKIVDGIDELHRHGIIWGDAKLSNVIIDANSDSVYFIDYETASLEKGGRILPTPMRTFQVVDHSFSSLKDKEIAHMLISFLFDKEVDNPRSIYVESMLDRSYDIHAKRTAKFILEEICRHPANKKIHPTSFVGG